MSNYSGRDPSQIFTYTLLSVIDNVPHQKHLGYTKYRVFTNSLAVRLKLLIKRPFNLFTYHIITGK